MPLPPLRRDQTLAVLKPNPMWILDQDDRLALYNILMPENGDFLDPALHLPLIAHDQYADVAEKTLQDLLKYWRHPNNGRALLYIHIEATIKTPTFVNCDGVALSRLPSDKHPVRRYFDGSSISAERIGHAAAGMIDFKNKEITVQDSQGIPIKPLVDELLQKYFPDYKFNDLQIKQQWDAHSCSIITMHNLECFYRREHISNSVDVNELRRRYAEHLSNPQRRFTQHARATRLYEKPVNKLPYEPV